jgi:hypothetical protein
MDDGDLVILDAVENQVIAVGAAADAMMAQCRLASWEEVCFFKESA